MTVRHVLTEPEETALAAAVEAGIIAEEALAGGFGVEATVLELALLVQEGHEARERLLLANTGLVKTIARGELGMSPAELSEVIQEGFLAMAEALLRYDHRRGRFGPYAAAWIRARVRTAITTQCGQVEVPVKELMRHFARRRAETDLMQKLGRTVSSAEVPGEIRLPGLQLVLARATLDAAHQVVDEAARSHLEAAEGRPNLAPLLGRLPPDQREGCVVASASTGRRPRGPSWPTSWASASRPYGGSRCEASSRCAGAWRGWTRRRPHDVG